MRKRINWVGLVLLLTWGASAEAAEPGMVKLTLVKAVCWPRSATPTKTPVLDSEDLVICNPNAVSGRAQAKAVATPADAPEFDPTGR